MPSILTVSQLNLYIHSLIDDDKNLHNLLIQGEISNFTKHYKTGHLYFSIKDSKSVVKCVMFADSARRLKFTPSDGMKVIISGRVSVYEASGQYQIYVKAMQPDGIGSLSLAYEQLKEKLENEGLFENHRTIPKYPSRIAIITSTSGAALHDIINITSRRWPVCELVIIPSSVQGEYAENQLVNGMKIAQETDSDVIIIGRGGGSLEDLWSFNSEKLAREIYSSRIPVISAVGHETDYTICDFVSDLRAPTPSAAAELAVPDIDDVVTEILSSFIQMRNILNNKIENAFQELDTISNKEVLSRPETLLNKQKQLLTLLNSKLVLSSSNSIGILSRNLSELTGKLEALNPLKVLSRGYTRLSKLDMTVTSVNELNIGDSIKIDLSDGTLKANITDIMNGKYNG